MSAYTAEQKALVDALSALNDGVDEEVMGRSVPDLLRLMDGAWQAAEALLPPMDEYARFPWEDGYGSSEPTR